MHSYEKDGEELAVFFLSKTIISERQILPFRRGMQKPHIVEFLHSSQGGAAHQRPRPPQRTPCNNDWCVFRVYALGVMVGPASSAICRDTSGSATSARSSAASRAANTSTQT